MLRIRRIGRKGMWLRRPLRGLRHNAFSSGLSVMRPVFGRDGLVPSVIAKVLQLPLGNKRKVKVKNDDEDDSIV